VLKGEAPDKAVDLAAMRGSASPRRTAMSNLITRDEEIAENARLRFALHEQGPVRILPPENRVILPNNVEMRGLLEAVMGKWPEDFGNVATDEFG
jgi:hypothetical protein